MMIVLKWAYNEGMPMFGLFKKKNPLVIAVKAPQSISTEDLSMEVELTFSSPEATTINSLVVRLRGDLADRKKAPSAAAYHYLGEATVAQEVKMAPDKPEKVTVQVPLDFSSLNAYEIPPENLAVASEAMKAAAAAMQSATYNYNVEVIARTVASDAETVARLPIQLIDPNTIRSSNF